MAVAPAEARVEARSTCQSPKGAKTAAGDAWRDQRGSSKRELTSEARNSPMNQALGPRRGPNLTEAHV